MIRLAATDITSPLGSTSRENYLAVRAGRSALCRIEGFGGIPEAITASLFSEEQWKEMEIPGFTRFESLVLKSIGNALADSNIDITSDRTIFILSTTKANVGNLGTDAYCSPADAALKIARHLGFTTDPVVVCNACISGVSAQILAKRLIESGAYDNAVVCGADLVTEFTVAGFLSFKALSPYECRPFDIERLGLNLGEAAATMVLTNTAACCDDKPWILVGGSLTNDAYHPSAPAPDGNGVCRAIDAAMAQWKGPQPSAISVHGTATMFNDQMESKAIAASGLSDIPVSSLKGYYGHTLGAAGILESIITMEALDDGMIPAARGFEEIGVSGRIDISATSRSATGHTMLKVISGFGGCNGALIYSRDVDEDSMDGQQSSPAEMEILHNIRINSFTATLDGRELEYSGSLTALYKEHIDDYPKFYKMDLLSKLVFTASELLIRQEPECDLSDCAIILFNRTSSIASDIRHLGCITGKEGFFPSPSVFLYTLPNIANGEVAIRRGIKGESSLYIINSKDNTLIDSIIQATIRERKASSVIYGWVDCSSQDCFEADLKLITIK